MPEHHLLWDHQPHPHPVKVCTIRQVVGRVGYCISNPQLVTYRKSRQEQQMMELVVHKVLTRHRRAGTFCVGPTGRWW